MRNNIWIEERLKKIWREHFSDIERLNKIEIKFGSKARRRLGSIRQINSRDKNSATKIIITGYFIDERVPETVVDVVIAHELTHYAHGFCSPLPKFSKYPHQGGIVDSELRKRGLAAQLRFQKSWLKNEWSRIIGKPLTRKRPGRIKRIRLFGLSF